MYGFDYSEYNFFQPVNQPSDFGTSYYYGGPTNPFDVDSRRYQYGAQQPQVAYTPQNTSPYQTPSFVQYPSQPAYQQRPGVPADSRRNDTVGNLNSDLFRSQQAYSQPIAQQQPAPQPRPQQMYMGFTPVHGFVNTYTQPPVPEDPRINWYEANQRANRPREPYPAYQYTGSYAGNVAPQEIDWVSVVNKNFELQNL